MSFSHCAHSAAPSPICSAPCPTSICSSLSTRSGNQAPETTTPRHSSTACPTRPSRPLPNSTKGQPTCRSLPSCTSITSAALLHAFRLAAPPSPTAAHHSSSTAPSVRPIRRTFRNMSPGPEQRETPWRPSEKVEYTSTSAARVETAIAVPVIRRRTTPASKPSRINTIPSTYSDSILTSCLPSKPTLKTHKFYHWICAPSYGRHDRSVRSERRKPMTFCLGRDDRVILAASLCSEAEEASPNKPVRLCQTNWGCNNR